MDQWSGERPKPPLRFSPRMMTESNSKLGLPLQTLEELEGNVYESISSLLYGLSCT